MTQQDKRRQYTGEMTGLVLNYRIYAPGKIANDNPKVWLNDVSYRRYQELDELVKSIDEGEG